jgi:hypothetical protein
LTKAGTVWGGARVVRNAVLRVLSSIPAVGEKMASIVEEIGVGYQDSPVVPANARHAKIQAGQHLPHIGDLDVQKQLSRVCGADESGHTILTVTTGRPAPTAGPAGQTQVLITSDDTPVGGYDAVITDPGGLFAQRLGLEDGGRVVVRPDGYLVAITALDDSTGVADYFALIAR